MGKETDKLISQFNKKVKQIKKEEIELDNLKAKYNQLTSGNKTPASLSAMESQLKRNEKELDSFKKKYDEILNQINFKQIDYKDAESTGNFSMQEKINIDLYSLDNEAKIVQDKIKSLSNESMRLKNELESIKINPAASIEAQNLKSKINLAIESLKESKKEANSLVNTIKQTEKVNLNSIFNGIKSVGNRITGTLIGKKGISGNIDNIGTKIDKFKSRITKLLGTVMIFRVLRNSLTSLSNGFLNLLKSNQNFSNSLNQIKVNLMTAFAPIYNYILPAINTLMNALSRVTGSIATFMASVFGKTATQAKKNAKELYNQANAQKAIGDAQEGTIASFDKLEVNGEESKSGGGSFNNLDFSKDIQTSTYLDNLLTDLKNKIGNGLWFDAGARIATDLNNVIEKIDVKGFFNKGKEVAKNLCLGINGFVATFDWKQLGTKISDAILGALDLLLVTLTTLDWQSIGKAIGDAILYFDWLGLGAKVIDIFISGFCGLKDLFIGVLDSIIEAIKDPEFMDKILQGGIDIILSLINGMMSVFSKIGEVFNKIIELFLTLFGIHSPSTIFEDFGKNIIEGLLNGINGLFNAVTEVFQSLLDSIKEIWTGTAEWFDTEVIQPIKNFFTDIWSTLVNGAENAWNGIKNVFSTVASFFQNTFSNAWSKVKSVFSTGGKIFDGIKDGIVSAFKNIVNAIIRGINKVVSVPFNGINNALKKIKNIDILGAKPFKNVVNTISVPQIPMLAQGAVIPPNAKFAAILGDQRNGKNLEAPEGLIRKIVREESGNGKEVILNGTFIIQCETEEIGRASIKGIRMIESETGTTLLVN